MDKDSVLIPICSREGPFSPKSQARQICHPKKSDHCFLCASIFRGRDKLAVSRHVLARRTNPGEKYEKTNVVPVGLDSVVCFCQAVGTIGRSAVIVRKSHVRNPTTLDEINDCPNGLKMFFQPNRWASEQLPLFVIAGYCDTTKPVFYNNSGVVCTKIPFRKLVNPSAEKIKPVNSGDANGMKSMTSYQKAQYLIRIVACIRPHITFNTPADSKPGQYVSLFEVNLLNNGRQSGKPKLLLSSGFAVYDSAVERAILRCNLLT